MTPVDLSKLPPPSVVEPLSYEAILAALQADLRNRLPGYTLLESDPVNIALEVCAYRETLLRARINDAARGNLLAFAAGGDLDHLAAFFNVARLSGETDERLQRRLQLHIAAMAGNGTREGYIARAMAAHPAVRDAAVLQPMSGAVAVALWLADGADANAVLETVRQAFAADDARPLGVQLFLVLTKPKAIAVKAKIYREASAPVDLVQRLKITLPQAFAAHNWLGRDLSRSWLQSKLHVDGVSRVELQTPASDVILAANEYALLGTVELQDAGVTW